MAEGTVLQILKLPNYGSHILEAQKFIFDNSDECDCIILSSEKIEIKAHKMVLSSSSEFFYKMLKDIPTSEIATVHLPDVDAVVLEPLIAFVYTGEASIPSALLTKVLDLCAFLEIKGYISGDSSINRTRMEGNSDCKLESEYFSDEAHDDNEDEEENDEYIIIDENYNTKDFADDEITVEYLEESEEYVTEFDESKDDGAIYFQMNELSDGEEGEPETSEIEHKVKGKKRKTGAYRKDMECELQMAFNQIATGKNLHQISNEFNVPRSTLYQKFRKNHYLQSNYRKERRSALEQAVRCVITERLSLKKASDRYNIPKTAIWRELRKTNQYQPPGKEITAERQQAQNEIIMGKSLTSISTKYGIPMTTLHRDKKRLSSEGKLPEALRVKDRTENSEYGRRLEQALQLCRKGLSQYQAAKMCNIPKATMWRHANALPKNQVEESKQENVVF